MQLTVNGNEKTLQSSSNITELLKELDIAGQHIAVAVNLQVIPRINYDNTDLKDGDEIEIVHAVGGG